MPKVSVNIPAYNPGPFLRAALQSVHDQAFSDWEAVVMDDASTQDLSWIEVEFPRVRLIRQRHGGASVARNTGILATKSEMISFMDQDDLWTTQDDGRLAAQAPRLLRRPRRLYAAQAYDCARRSLHARSYLAAAHDLWNAFCFDPTFVTRSLLRYATRSSRQ